MAAVLKTARSGDRPRGFESHALRQLSWNGIWPATTLRRVPLIVSGTRSRAPLGHLGVRHHAFSQGDTAACRGSQGRAAGGEAACSGGGHAPTGRARYIDDGDGSAMDHRRPYPVPCRAARGARSVPL